MGMSGLYIGLSGLQTASNSLNTTANNLSNVNTTGYVRQQVVNADKTYVSVSTTSATTTGQYGLGSTIADINHVRDIFLDIAYRREYGRESFYYNLYDAVYEIETQMGETDFISGIGFQSYFSDILEALNEVAKTPGDQTARSALVQSAVQFLETAQNIYNGLVNYQSNLNQSVIDTVARINEIGEELVDLNRRIAKIEAGGIEDANDLRDARDLLLDELSSYVKISYSEEASGSVTVYIEGVQFADDLGYSALGLETIEGTGMVNPVWTSLGNQSLYNLNSTISTENNTDIGGLKGLLIARGSVTPTAYTMETPDPADYADGEDDPEYIAAVAKHEQYVISQQTSALVNALANFDKLVSSIVSAINDIFCPETTVTASDGTVYTVLDTEQAPMTTDGEIGVELFTRNYCDRYVEQTIDGVTYYVRNNYNSYGSFSGYTISELSVNADILQDYSRIPLTEQDGSDAYEKAEQLVTIFSEELLYYNGGTDSLTFEEFYEALINDIGNTGTIYLSMAENETTLRQQIDSQRQAIMGVSSDEELTNMIRYQQAYNAASRYINVVSEMMETLIYNLGVG